MRLGTSSEAFDIIVKFCLAFICASIESTAVWSTGKRAIEQQVRDSMITYTSKNPPQPPQP